MVELDEETNVVAAVDSFPEETAVLRIAIRGRQIQNLLRGNRFDELVTFAIDSRLTAILRLLGA